MGWDGSGNFNRTDGTRTGTTVWADAKTAGVKILSNDHDTHDQDLADGLENCIARDGQVAATADIPMGGFTLTGMADSGAVQEPTSTLDIQNSQVVYAAAGGSSADYTLTLAPAITAYVTGQRFIFKANHVSDDASTLNVNGLGAKNILDVEGAAYRAETIQTNQIMDVIYDGTQFVTTYPRRTPWVDASGDIDVSSQPGTQTYTSLTVTHARYQITGRTIHVSLDMNGTIANPDVEIRIGGWPAILQTGGDLYMPAHVLDNSALVAGFGNVNSSSAIDVRRYDSATYTAGSVFVRINALVQTTA